MTATELATIIMAGVMVLGMLGSVIALTFRMGALSGQIVSFMQTSQRDRAEVLTQLGKLDERLDRHVEKHRGDYE